MLAASAAVAALAAAELGGGVDRLGVEAGGGVRFAGDAGDVAGVDQQIGILGGEGERLGDVVLGALEVVLAQRQRRGEIPRPSDRPAPARPPCRDRGGRRRGRPARPRRGPDRGGPRRAARWPCPVRRARRRTPSAPCRPRRRRASRCRPAPRNRRGSDPAYFPPRARRPRRRWRRSSSGRAPYRRGRGIGGRGCRRP